MNELEQLKNKKINSINLYQYINNNIINIDCAKYVNKGYFIGSGFIESGNKIVLQDRLKRAGQRWNPETAQNMVTLKAKYLSDYLWESDVVQLVQRLYCN